MAVISVIGTGYVGLTTGACFAHLGHEVHCADIDAAKIERLRRGEIPIVEAGLDRIVEEGMRSGLLHFTDDPIAAARVAEFHFLCVPTPQGRDGAADLTYLRAAAAQIGPVLPEESIIINKSTVPVGTTSIVEEVVARQDVRVVSNPEFLREGSAVHDFLNPDRIVIGAADQSAAIRVAGLYARVPAPVMVTDPVSSEMIKYASNAFLAAKLSYVNAIANLCEAVGADVDDVVLGMGYDRRIGKDFLRPGPGWGGSCFPKDTTALHRIAADAGYDFAFLAEVMAVNDQQFDRTARKVVDACGGDVDGCTIGALGLTFKAGTDDLRESPALEVLGRLVAQGARVQAYDPAVSGTVPGHPTIEVVDDPYAAADGAAVLVVLTEWDEFRWLDFDKIGDAMAARCIVDTRNLLDRALLRRRSFVHLGVGR